ncbi:hypothetical protein PG994_010297 [Apiospora phragmitis]|uniref:Uncharacterized protein n=1 Tax=Apiospora phragmitis TaxID=2905665 RepID=A0ABR1TPQ8_9PEZI
MRPAHTQLASANASAIFLPLRLAHKSFRTLSGLFDQDLPEEDFTMYVASQPVIPYLRPTRGGGMTVTDTVVNQTRLLALPPNTDAKVYIYIRYLAHKTDRRYSAIPLDAQQQNPDPRGRIERIVTALGRQDSGPRSYLDTCE